MILGKPNNTEDYICVFSEDAITLAENGFVPLYRSLTEDSVYFIKSKELTKVVVEWNLRTK